MHFYHLVRLRLRVKVCQSAGKKQVYDLITESRCYQYVTEGLPLIGLDSGLLQQFTTGCRLRSFIRFQYACG